MSASCCGSARNKAVLVILSALLWSLAIIAVWRMATEKPPQVEMVHVLVASRDLTTGTAFTQDNVDELITFKDLPRSTIPEGAQIILKKEELVGKRLSHATHQGEYFNVADVGIRTPILWETGADIMSIPLSAAAAADQVLIGPGSQVDIIASYVEGTERHVFTLLPDKLVLAVGAGCDLVSPEEAERGGPRPDKVGVSFAVDQKQSLLFPLAYQLNCNFEIVLRRPDSPKRDYDIDKTLARLKELAEKRESRIAPPPRVKDEE